MKTASLGTLILLLLTTSIIAQETSDPPDVNVLEKSWSKEIQHRDREPRDPSDPRKRNTNPLGPNEDLMEQTRQEKQVIANRADSRTTEMRMPLPTDPRDSTRVLERRTSYLYRIKVKNNGLKTIKALHWEYQFLDRNTQAVLGTHRLVSSQELSPGKTGEFKARSGQSPAASVSAKQTDKEFQNKFTERVTIHRIYYTDGSVWQRPSSF